MTDAGFGQRLSHVRRQQGLTQQVVADRAGVHVTNVRRYEAGKAAPTVHILRNLAIALHVSADALLFDPGERGPGDDLALRLEAVSHLDDDEKSRRPGTHRIHAAAPRSPPPHRTTRRRAVTRYCRASARSAGRSCRASATKR